MSRSSFLLRMAMLCIAASCVFAPTARPVLAQSYDCERLRQELAASGRADPQRTAQFVRAEQRQRVELARTQAYSEQIGCNRGFSFFSDAPPQCDAIQAQIDRMNGNLGALQQQIAQFQGGDPNRQAALEQQYRASCAVEDAALNPSDSAIRPEIDGSDPDTNQPAETGSRRYSKAICVRTCDGGFFPLSFSPAQRDTQGMQNLCSALCPNTEVKLYTTPDLDNISAAVSIEGAGYSDLPNAFKYQKTFDATCSCKPPNKSWVEALANAEQLLDKSEGKDVTVTAKMSDEMARPVAAAPPGTPTRKKAFSKAEIKALLDAQAAAEGALGAVGAQAPTASKDSAGIAADATTQTDHLVRAGEGAVKALPGPDGTKRRVRTVVPGL